MTEKGEDGLGTQLPGPSFYFLLGQMLCWGVACHCCPLTSASLRCCYVPGSKVRCPALGESWRCLCLGDIKMLPEHLNDFWNSLLNEAGLDCFF